MARATLEAWLVRHGETPRSRDRRLAGWVDTPLTALGRRQAEALRPLLSGRKFDSVWSSDLRRAVATARLAFGEPRRDLRLREISFGALEGRRWDELEPCHRDALVRFDGFRAPGGESLSDLGLRVLSFVRELSEGRHLLFTHGGVIRLLSRECGHDGFLATGAAMVLDWRRRRVLLVTDAAS